MNREIMKQAGFGQELEMIDKGLCPTCGKSVGQFSDALSSKEFGISGMCQACQDETFTEHGDQPEDLPYEPPKDDRVGLEGDTFVVDRPYRMFSGAAEAARFVYRKLVTTKGTVWLYPVNTEAPAEQVHFHDPKDTRSDGYGGATLSFLLEDGTTYAAKGPWHASAGAMFTETGVDIRDTHWTYGCVARRRRYENNVQFFDGVLHADTKPVLGQFDRLEKIALEHANRLNVPVAYYSESKGGSSSSHAIPEGTEWKDWTKWFSDQASVETRAK